MATDLNHLAISATNELAKTLHPLDPSLAQTLVESPNTSLSPLSPRNSQNQFQKTINTLKSQIQNQIDELHAEDIGSNQKKVKKSKQKISMMDSEKWMEYVKQLEDKNEILEHRLEDLHEKFDKYKVKAELRQDTFIRREKSYKEKDYVINQKLKNVMENHTHEGAEMKRLKSLKGQINDRISAMQMDFDTILNQQKESHKSEIEDTIRKFTRELEMERKKNSMEEKNWQEKATAMKESLQEAVLEAIKLDEQNEKLIKKNKELVISFKAQENDRNIILKNLAQMKREKQRLAERILQLEQEVEYHSTISKQLENELNDFKERNNNADENIQTLRTIDQKTLREREIWYEETIARLKKLLEQEKKNVKVVRQSHLKLLSERSELEIFLRQCIDDVRTEISQQKTSEEATTFTLEDRKRVLEMLLSKDKVINLLYDKMFPYKPKVPPMQQTEEEYVPYQEEYEYDEE